MSGEGSGQAAAVDGGVAAPGGLRVRTDTITWTGRQYSWESMHISPHTHSGVPVRRERVYYVGVLKDGWCC